MICNHQVVGSIPTTSTVFPIERNYMKTFRVKQVHLTEKTAYVSIEAPSEHEAISRARTLQWEEFEQRESVDQTQWKVDDPANSIGFFEKFLSFFTGKY